MSLNCAAGALWDFVFVDTAAAGLTIVADGLKVCLNPQYATSACVSPKRVHFGLDGGGNLFLEFFVF